MTGTVQALLIVAHGTLQPEGRAAYRRFHRRIRERFPGLTIRWALSSGPVRQGLAKQGHQVDSPSRALADLVEDGLVRIAVLPLHVVPGRDFHDLCVLVKAFPGVESRIGQPFLSSSGDLRRITAALTKMAGDYCDREDRLVLMGHGTDHPADLAYPALAWALERTGAGIYLASLKGLPEFDQVLAELRREMVARVHLRPLTIVPGRHAYQDLAGERPESWASRLAAAGIKTKLHLRGILDQPDLAEIFLNHAARIVNA